MRLLTGCTQGAREQDRGETCLRRAQLAVSEGTCSGEVGGAAPTCPADLALWSGLLRLLLAGTRHVLRLEIKA